MPTPVQQPLLGAAWGAAAIHFPGPGSGLCLAAWPALPLGQGSLLSISPTPCQCRRALPGLAFCTGPCTLQPLLSDLTGCLGRGCPCPSRSLQGRAGAQQPGQATGRGPGLSPAGAWGPAVTIACSLGTELPKGVWRVGKAEARVHLSPRADRDSARAWAQPRHAVRPGVTLPIGPQADHPLPSIRA